MYSVVDLANTVSIRALISPMAWLTTNSTKVVSIRAIALAFVVVLALVLSFIALLSFILALALAVGVALVVPGLSSERNVEPSSFLALLLSFALVLALAELDLIHFHWCWALIV